MIPTPTTCGIWHVDHITSPAAAGRFVTAHAKMLQMQLGWRCWLRKLPAGDDREIGKGRRFYGPTEDTAIFEAAIWLYRSWRKPGAPARRIGTTMV